MPSTWKSYSVEPELQLIGGELRQAAAGSPGASARSYDGKAVIKGSLINLTDVQPTDKKTSDPLMSVVLIRARAV